LATINAQSSIVSISQNGEKSIPNGEKNNKNSTKRSLIFEKAENAVKKAVLNKVWHEYQRHTDEAVEIGRNQVPFTVETMTDAIMAIYEPDVVESLFAINRAPNQRQSFVYAKKASNGHYVVVEAVGGKRNPNVTPVMILYFSAKKWDDVISSGVSLGEILYENDPKFKSALDIEFNKKNRVTATQFASDEAIANTSRSPRFTNSIPQNGEKSTPNGEKTKNSTKRSLLFVTSGPEGKKLVAKPTRPPRKKRTIADKKGGYHFFLNTPCFLTIVVL